MQISRKIKTIINANFVFNYLLIPIALLTAYFASFTFFSFLLLPKGVNYDFTSRTTKYLTILLIAVFFITIIIKGINCEKKLSFNKVEKRIKPGDFLFLLIPLTPIVQYIVTNGSILTPVNASLILAFFVLLSGIYIFLFPAFFGIFSSNRRLMILGIAFVYTINNMALLSREFSWFQEGSLKTQLLFFGVAICAIYALFSLKNNKVLYISIIVFFISSTTIKIFSVCNLFEKNPLPTTENNIFSVLQGKAPIHHPNVYLLVYDSYVINETMIEYGIDNSSQEDYLSDHDFVLYPHTYSIGSSTINSMGRVFNITNSSGGDLRLAVAGDGLVQTQFKNLGYKTYGIFPSEYEFRGVGSFYDISYPEHVDVEVSPTMLLVSAILIGEFRFDLGFYKQKTFNQYIQMKTSILERVPDNQVFFFSHSTLPSHSQNSGKCRPEETEQFEERLAKANLEMEQNVETIIANDPNAVIIIAGDHGPYLTKNCTGTKKDYGIAEISRLDIQDRFGTFLAIRWPTIDYTDFDNIVVLQDLFPVIFAYLYGDSTLLDYRVIPDIQETWAISGVSVKDGIIYGGIDDGQPLFDKNP